MIQNLDEEDIASAGLQHLRHNCQCCCKDRGFTENEINTCVGICTQLYEAVDGDTSLIKSIAHFQDLIRSNCSKLTSRSIEIFTEFVSSTFLQHFALYKYVKTVPRVVLKKEERELVRCLEPPLPFSEGTPYKVWEYEQQMGAVNTEAQQANNCKVIEAASLRDERKEVIKKVQSLYFSSQEQMTIRERVRQLASESVTTQADLMQRMLLHELDSSQADLDRDITRAVIGRPSTLGPLPLRPVPSRGVMRETRDLQSQIASRVNTTQESGRKSAGKKKK